MNCKMLLMPVRSPAFCDRVHKAEVMLTADGAFGGLMVEALVNLLVCGFISDFDSCLKFNNVQAEKGKYPNDQNTHTHTLSHFFPSF